MQKQVGPVLCWVVTCLGGVVTVGMTVTLELSSEERRAAGEHHKGVQGRAG